MAADTNDAKSMYGDGELPGDADLSSEASNGASPAEQEPGQPHERDSATDEDDPVDDVADALPGPVGDHRPDSPAPLP